MSTELTKEEEPNKNKFIKNLNDLRKYGLSDIVYFEVLEKVKDKPESFFVIEKQLLNS